MIYAFYLPKEFIDDIEPPCQGDEFENQITDHPETKRYSISSLEEAYNNEKRIVGGYLIFLDLSIEELSEELKQRYKENKIPEHLKERPVSSEKAYPSTGKFFMYGITPPIRSLEDMLCPLPTKFKLKPDPKLNIKDFLNEETKNE